MFSLIISGVVDKNQFSKSLILVKDSFYLGSLQFNWVAWLHLSMQVCSQADFDAKWDPSIQLYLMQ